MSETSRGQCIVAFGYDVDMPTPDEYLYERALGWPWDGEVHGRVNDDVAAHVCRLAQIAERHGAPLQFFLQGNAFEAPIDLWKEIAERGHAIDQHCYHHISLEGASAEEARDQVGRTKPLIEEHLGTPNTGIRGPEGYVNGLDHREDVQQALLDSGMEWITCRYEYPPSLPERTGPGIEDDTIRDIASCQPYLYPTGLLEIPLCLYQDRSYFDVDMGGDPTASVDQWVAYLKRGVDFAAAQGLVLSLTLHPSTSLKHDPDARYLDEVLAYCRQRPDVSVGTYRDIYVCVSPHFG